MLPLETVMAIAAGAVPGALARYYVGLWSDRHFGMLLFGTLTVNLTGAFLMGLLSYSLAQWQAPPWLNHGITVGFLGSLTTFSTFTLETTNLWRQHLRRAAWLYWLGTPLLGFLCVEAGLSVARWIAPTP